MTSQVLVTLKKFINGPSLLCCAVIACASVQPALAAGPARSDTARELERTSPALLVGEVSLVLGKAYLQSPNQPQKRIKIGSQIKVSDRITTEANGHVHIKFVDEALVSVRPDSQLDILSYDYNALQPERSLIKFELVKGETRAISGKAAKAAKDRFRLNTPIAAIGVRGTDFMVKATDSAVRVLVTEGAIIMAPFSDECTSDSYGPCVANAVELASQSLQILELEGTNPLPQLLPASLLHDPESARSEAQLLVADLDVSDEQKSPNKGVYLEGVTSTTVAVEEKAVKPTTPVTPTTPDPPVTQPPAVPDFTPAVTVPAQNLTARQLVWGRFLSAGQDDLERITLSYDQASADRAQTIGTTAYGLFRPENGNKELDKGLGVVNFSLSSAQAFYDSSSGVVAMKVEGGNLGIDFQEFRFATELNLSHDSTGAVDFIASGQINDAGYFHSRNDSQLIKGAVTLDGKEAGYFFEKQLEAGNIQGLTLWDSQ